jgi:hypothetical protein
MSRNVSKESDNGLMNRADQQQFNVGSALSRAFSDSELAEMAQMHSLNAVGSITPASAAERAEDRYERESRGELSFGRVDNVGTIASPVTPIFGSAPRHDGLGIADGEVRFGDLPAIRLDEARQRATLERERSSERARLMVMEGEARRARRASPAGLGLAIPRDDVEGKGKGKENTPLS